MRIVYREEDERRNRQTDGKSERRKWKAEVRRVMHYMGVYPRCVCQEEKTSYRPTVLKLISDCGDFVRIYN